MAQGIKVKRIYSKERNKKISEALKGNTNGRFRKNTKHTEETKKKISKAKLGTKSHRKGLTVEQEYGKEKANILREKYRKNAINTLNKLKKSKTSKAEIILKNFFIRNNFNFIHQWKYKYGIADFFLPDFNMIIECDGDYWHSKPDYIKRDTIKRDYLKRKGYIVFVHSSEKIVKAEKSYK